MPVLVRTPLLFVCIYLILAILTASPTGYGLPYAITLAIVGFIGAFAVHLYWVFLTLRLTTRARKDNSKYSKLAMRAGIGGTSLAVVSTILRTFSAPHITDNSIANAAYTIMEMMAAFSLLSVFWFAARSLCDAEDQRKTPASKVVGTFLLYLYIVIGAFFISRRLKNLSYQQP